MLGLCFVLTKYNKCDIINNGTIKVKERRYSLSFLRRKIR